MNPIDFIHDFQLSDAPDAARAYVPLALLDLVGVAAGGATTRAAGIMAGLVADQFGGPYPLLFATGAGSPGGAALSAGMTIDALDGHDGYNPSKGHIGCPLFAALLPQALALNSSGADVIAALAMGYEFGARAAEAQHGTVPDYHTSGSWGAVAAAASCARLRRLSRDQTRHALGIAEYHGPRSQMMRCIDHPTMLKDGAGWGAMAGIIATDLAARGFTGAPAITIEQAPDYWTDLGSRWALTQQYMKPYPICRWAQPSVEAALALMRDHDLHPDQIAHVTVDTFHEAIRLATRHPTTTEEAQYSTAFPLALAVRRGGISPADLADTALAAQDIHTLADQITFTEADFANSAFPQRRFARVTLGLSDGTTRTSDWTEPGWDHTAPATAEEVRRKYDALTLETLDQSRSRAIADVIQTLADRPFSDLATLICQPINAATTCGNVP